jgi:hypothetical protein
LLTEPASKTDASLTASQCAYHRCGANDLAADHTIDRAELEQLSP